MNRLDKIVQDINKTRIETGFNTRRIQSNFPLVERKLDVISGGQDYHMEFPLTKREHSVLLTLRVKPDNCCDCDPGAETEKRDVIGYYLESINGPAVYSSPLVTESSTFNWGYWHGMFSHALYEPYTPIGIYTLHPNGGIEIPNAGVYTVYFEAIVDGGAIGGDDSSITASIRVGTWDGVLQANLLELTQERDSILVNWQGAVDAKTEEIDTFTKIMGTLSQEFQDKNRIIYETFKYSLIPEYQASGGTIPSYLIDGYNYTWNTWGEYWNDFYTGPQQKLVETGTWNGNLAFIEARDGTGSIYSPAKSRVNGRQITLTGERVIVPKSDYYDRKLWFYETYGGGYPLINKGIAQFDFYTGGTTYGGPYRFTTGSDGFSIYNASGSGQTGEWWIESYVWNMWDSLGTLDANAWYTLKINFKGFQKATTTIQSWDAGLGMVRQVPYGSYYGEVDLFKIWKVNEPEPEDWVIFYNNKGQMYKHPKYWDQYPPTAIDGQPNGNWPENGFVYRPEFRIGAIWMVIWYTGRWVNGTWIPAPYPYKNIVAEYPITSSMNNFSISGYIETPSTIGLKGKDRDVNWIWSLGDAMMWEGHAGNIGNPWPPPTNESELYALEVEWRNWESLVLDLASWESELAVLQTELTTIQSQRPDTTAVDAEIAAVEAQIEAFVAEVEILSKKEYSVAKGNLLPGLYFDTDRNRTIRLYAQCVTLRAGDLIGGWLEPVNIPEFSTRFGWGEGSKSGSTKITLLGLGYAILIGNVYDSVTQAPIEGVTISYTVGFGGSTTTNTYGSYTFDNLRADTFNITATKSGYISQTQSIIVYVGLVSELNFSLNHV